MSKSCELCRFSVAPVAGYDSEVECRRTSPMTVLSNGRGAWPLVDKGAFCWEFQPKYSGAKAERVAEAKEELDKAEIAWKAIYGVRSADSEEFRNALVAFRLAKERFKHAAAEPEESALLTPKSPIIRENLEAVELKLADRGFTAEDLRGLPVRLSDDDLRGLSIDDAI